MSPYEHTRHALRQWMAEVREKYHVSSTEIADLLFTESILQAELAIGNGRPIRVTALAAEGAAPATDAQRVALTDKVLNDPSTTFAPLEQVERKIAAEDKKGEPNEQA